MHLTVSHTLVFDLGTPQRALAHLLLTPNNTAQQTVERWSIDMPGIEDAAVFRDGYGNRVQLVTLNRPEEPIMVTVNGAVTTSDKAGVLGRIEYDPVPALFRRHTETAKADETLLAAIGEDDGRIALLHALMERCHVRHGEAAQEQTQEQDGGGQSQAQATAEVPSIETPELVHSFIGCARALGVPARYVTGYLFDEGKARLHAWAEAWDDRLGWIGFDPVLNVCPADQHLRLASGLDAMSSMPIRTVPAWSGMPAETLEIIAAQEPST